MKFLRALAGWLDIRPNEARPLLLSAAGAFLVMAYLVLSRSLREALYLTSFDVKTLPYVTVATSALTLPAVYVFSRMLVRYDSLSVLRATLLIQGAGLAGLWLVLGSSRGAIVAFYLWTALGTLVITSGYWVLTTDLFPLRSAKRLFGLIGAAGTAGVMIMGTSLSWLTSIFPTDTLVLLLVSLVFLAYLVQRFLPRPDEEQEAEAEASVGKAAGSGFRAFWPKAHLRSIGLIVITATMATTLVDYQFKDLLSQKYDTEQGLASILGALYGWTGAASLVIQLLIGARVLKTFGIGWVLSILPLILLGGSISFLIAPSLALILLVRGADLSLRKSLHRSALEVLFIPVPSPLRRQTKTFIDSVFDSVSQGVGAGIIFVCVTWAALPSVYLSVFVILLTGSFLILNVIMSRQYFQTLLDRLDQPERGPSDLALEAKLAGHASLSESLECIALPPGLLRQHDPETAVDSGAESRTSERPSVNFLAEIQSGDDAAIVKTLDGVSEWREAHMPALIRLLARDGFFARVTRLLVEHSHHSLPYLVETIKDELEDTVVRRRTPRVLSLIPGQAAENALLDALLTDRFEIRYRAGLALRCREQSGAAFSHHEGWTKRIWTAIRRELNREKAVWELQGLLDRVEDEDDAFVLLDVKGRGKLSLAHTFRLLALVLDSRPVLTAFHGLLLDNVRLKSIALEYLELVLPRDIRKRLWPFIGDLSEHQRRKSSRPLKDVMSDLAEAGATLVASQADTARLRKALGVEDP